MTIEEGKTPAEIDEEDELDGWGPVRVRRSSIPTRIEASPTTEESQRKPAQAGDPPPDHKKLLA
jgi:hypothetical protein